MTDRPAILLLSTGGTITMTARPDGAGVTPTLQAADLAASVPGLAAVAQVTPVSVARKPSASLTLADLVALARRIVAGAAEGARGAVVVQGTDTIEETAFVLSLLLPRRLPVVVTGAMRAPTMAGADGPANLLAAVTVASAPETIGLGPVVVLNDEVHAAQHVQKGHTALTSAFASPGYGPLGVVAEGRLRLALRPAEAPCTLADLLEMSTEAVLQQLAAWDARAQGAGAGQRALLAGPGQATCPPVALLRIGLGDDGRLLAAAPELGFVGVVIEGAGAGHVPEDVAAIVSEVAARVPVALASRVAAGPAFSRTYGYAGSEIDLLQRGAISAGRLSGLKARLALQLLLQLNVSGERLRASMSRLAA